MFMKFWEPRHMWKFFILTRKVQVKFFLKLFLVTFNNICVGFKNMTLSITCIIVFQSKFLNENLSIKSLTKESNIVGSLINWCYEIFGLGSFKLLFGFVLLKYQGSIAF